MSILVILLFALSTNLDNLVIGVTYGIKRMRIPVTSNLIVALITFLGTILSMALGNTLAGFLPEATAQVIGSIVLLMIGLYSIGNYLRQRARQKTPHRDVKWPMEKPEKYDANRDKRIDGREALLLGVALALNNMGLGIAASAMGLAMLPVALLSCAVSFFSVLLGNWLGVRYLGRASGARAELLSGLIIVALALWGLLL